MKALRTAVAAVMAALLLAAPAVAGPLGIGKSVEDMAKVTEERGGASIVGAGECPELGVEYVVYVIGAFGPDSLAVMAVRDDKGRAFLIELQVGHSHIVGLPESMSGAWTFVRDFDDKKYEGGPVCPALAAALKIAKLSPKARLSA